MKAATTTTSLKQEMYNESLQEMREQLERMVAKCKKIESEIESGDRRCTMWSEAEQMAYSRNELKESFIARTMDN